MTFGAKSVHEDGTFEGYQAEVYGDCVVIRRLSDPSTFIIPFADWLAFARLVSLVRLPPDVDDH